MAVPTDAQTIAARMARIRGDVALCQADGNDEAWLLEQLDKQRGQLAECAEALVIAADWVANWPQAPMVEQRDWQRLTTCQRRRVLPEAIRSLLEEI